MLKTFARAAAVAAALLCATAALAQKSFVRDDLASEGVRLEEKLKTEAGSTAAGRPAAQLRRDAEGLMSRVEPARRDEPLRRRGRARAEERRQLGRLRARPPRRSRPRITPSATSSGSAAPPPPMSPISAPRRAPTRPRRSALLGDLYAMREDWRPALNAYRGEPAARRRAGVAQDLRGRCARSTASASPTTRSIRIPPRRASASSSPSRWRQRQGRFRALRRGVGRGQRRGHRPRARSSASTA